MDIELIAPLNEDSSFLPSLGLGIVAAHTPRDVRVHYTDELVTPIDLERPVEDVDLAAITINSKTARRGYAIADTYRRAGVPVVLGGIHATALPEESRRHADAVVVGEAEGLWEELMADFAAKRPLRPIYRRDGWPSLDGLPRPRRELFTSKKYIPFQTVQTTRGCPFPCEFCSVSIYNGGKFRFRPVPEVVAEIESLEKPRELLKKLVLFADDNVMIHRGYSRELFEAMVPLGVHWVGQASLAGLGNPLDVELMARSGCRAVFIGFESVDDGTVRSAGKRQNKPRKYQEVIDSLHANGIAVWGSFVFGFDEDDESVFERTVEFCVESQLTMCLFAILTPYPGTMLYQRLAREGRLTHPTWWLDGHDFDRAAPFYRPARMSPERLHRGWVEAWQSFYSLSSIWKRFRTDLDQGWISLLGHFPLNLFMHVLADRKIARGERLFLHAGQAARLRRPGGGASMPLHDETVRVAPPLPGPFGL